MSHPDFPVVDAHVHLYPDHVAPRVVVPLAGRFGNEPSFDGTVGGCLAKDASDGIAVSVNLPVATKAESVAHTNAFWSEFASARRRSADADADGRRVVSLAAFHPGLGDLAGEVERIASAGFAGIKLHPEYQLFRFNDRDMDDAWAAMEEFGVVAYLHAGGERVFSPPFHSSPREVAELQRRFPRLRMVAAHLGGFGMWDEAEEVLVGTDVFLDLSHTFFWMPHERILRMIRRHGANRILFGTDAPWQDPGKVLEAFLSLPLCERDRSMICRENATELLRL